MEELRYRYRIKAEQRLLDRFQELGDTEKQIEAYLGHPIAQVTDEEWQELEDYLDKAEEAKRKGEKVPVLRKKTKPTKKR